MLDIEEILATERMFDQNKLDVRTITMGISLLGCVSDDEKTLLSRIYDTICQKAEHLTEVSHDISREYGVPIINRRISVTPVALIAGGTNAKSYVPIAETLQKAADVVGVDILGGFSALVDRGMSSSDKILIDSIPEALAVTKSICSSVAIGSTKAGINMDAVKRMGEIVKETAEITKDQDAYGCTKLVEFCNAVEDNPFMAGAFHGVTQGDTAIHVGVSGPGVVKRALEDVKGAPLNVVAKTIKNTAFMITRLGQMVAEAAVDRLHAPFGIIDLSLAPTSAVGDSVAQVLEEMGLESCGGPGTTAALALLNDAVKKGGLMASSSVGGLSGAFIPVSEDLGMIEAVQKGSLSLEKLEAMTCVCSVGLDMIAVPGDTKATTLAGIIADESAIGMVNQKTTAVRLIPVIGKGVGETVEFGGLLGYAPIMPVNSFSCDAFVQRGGRIPAPIHSFKN
uniref:PFL family protein n=1 Tax=Dialister hominis TaxID=2582419 RepID=UPI003FEFF416